MAELDTRKIAEDFNRDGALRTLRSYVQQGTITKDQAAQWTAQLFKIFALKIEEAKKEVQRLDAVLQRLAVVVAQGRRKRAYVEQDPLVMSLAQELGAFDGWVMSLYETDLTMISYGAPDRARATPSEMAASMNALYQKRLEEMKFQLKAPELFKLG